MNKDAVNIYDIARMSGVSIATVSRVMNGSEKVSEKTRKKVMDVIGKVGYTPNVFAQGLGLNTMHTVGILVPTIADQYMSSAVGYLETELIKHGYDCILGNSGFDLEGKQKKTEMLLSKHIDSLILVGSTYAGDGSDTNATEYIRAAAKRVPVFIINGNVNGENIYASVCEDEKAIYEAATSMLRRGRKNIVFLTDSHSYSANKKKNGYERAMKSVGKAAKEAKDGIIYVENHIHRVRDQLLAMEDLKCDGIIASNDMIAIGAVKYALAKGMNIPEDIEIIGYNNSALAISCIPEVTSIDNHTEEICRDTVDRIMQILDGGEEKLTHKISVPCMLIPRETTM